MVVGNKHIGKQSPFFIENLSLKQRINLKSTPPNYVNDFNSKINKSIKSIDNVYFFDIQKLLLDKNGKGIVCDNRGNLISYDGGHLTKNGVLFISKKLPTNIKKIIKWK